jgi:hypothetical protein
VLGEPDDLDQLLGGDDPLGEHLLLGLVRRVERGRVRVEGQPPAYDLDPRRRVPGGGHLDGEPEPVQQLRAQLALLGVHRADQHEARGVLDRDAVALDGGPAHRSGVQQQVDEVVVEQVDLVDVQDAAVSSREQAGLVLGTPLGQRALEVQRPEHPVLCGADRQLDESHRAGLDRGVGSERPVGGQRRCLPRVAGEPVAGDHVDGRQHRGQRADDRGLRRTLLAAHEHPADVRQDRRQDEGERHVVGADDGGEGIVLWHGGSRSSPANTCA